jgi:F-box and leucine-rich repeat protein 2/20
MWLERVAKGCRLITDDLLLALSKGYLQLEELGASGCNSIADVGISSLVDGCHQIKALGISKCSKVGDSGLCKIAVVSSSDLVSLKLMACIKVGHKSIYSYVVMIFILSPL